LDTGAFVDIEAFACTPPLFGAGALAGTLFLGAATIFGAFTGAFFAAACFFGATTPAFAFFRTTAGGAAFTLAGVARPVLALAMESSP
jgi:hypothetical protein